MFKIQNYWRTILLAAVLLLSGAFIQYFEQTGEAGLNRRPLKEIPDKLGNWQQLGRDERFDASIESVLKTDDYLMRNYFIGGRSLNLYIGYYASQRTGATYHSPQNCLPGSGWTMTEPGLVEIKTADGQIFLANRYIVQNGDYRSLLIYWYQGRGRFLASEYSDKFYTIVDSIGRRRSDGAMVRVMTPLDKSEEESLTAAADFSSQIASNLSEFVPN
jgi:EpsI family protein